MTIPTYTETYPNPMAPMDLHLKPESPYNNTGTDNKDLGADIDALNRGLCGVLEGKPCIASSVPRPPMFPGVKE